MSPCEKYSKWQSPAPTCDCRRFPPDTGPSTSGRTGFDGTRRMLKSSAVKWGKAGGWTEIQQYKGYIYIYVCVPKSLGTK